MKNRVEDVIIWEAYKRFMEGESLTKIAQSISIDRGTLKRYIEKTVIPNLSEKEKEKFEEKFNKNFRGNSNGEGRIGRNKKGKSLKGEEYQKAQQEIQNYGISDENINQLYQILSSRKNTKYAQDTYLIKLVEFLKYFVEKGLTSEQVIDMLYRRPQIFSADIGNTINPIIEDIERKHKIEGKTLNSGAYEIYEHPGIVTRGGKKKDTKANNKNEKNQEEAHGEEEH